MIRPYIAESEILPGTGVVQGECENTARRPNEEGAGDFIGVYAYEPRRETKNEKETLGVVISGVVKVRAGGNVRAGKRAVLKADESGSFIEAAGAGTHPVCGMFLESGDEDEYVEMLIERGCVSIEED